MNDSEIFLTAVQIEEPQARQAFLASVCGSDPEQHRRIVARIEKYLEWLGGWDNYSQKLAMQFMQTSTSVENFSEEQAAIEDRTPSTNTLVAGSRLGSYEILRCIGIGGMGEVYLAHDDRLDRNVALKMLPQRYVNSPQWLKRFEREAKSASSLNHPNILTIFEIGNSGDSRFIASEFVPGQSLRDLVGMELDLDKKLSLGIQIAEALFAAHSANIVHRDIKPENVMVRPDGLVKVLDFGIAKYYATSSIDASALSHCDTDPGFIMGTVRYMSPEQARRQSIDFRADLFSLGVVMFELLTGALPYQSHHDAGILTTLISDEPLRLDRLAQVSQIELEQCIRKLLRKDRDARYQSAKEVIVDLRQARRQLDRPVVHFRDGEIVQDENRRQFSATTNRTSATDTTIEIPEVRYARSGDVNIAYQIVGRGELDLVFVMGWVSHLDWFWREPSFARFLKRLSSIARLIVFDKRGTGLSDRVPHDQLPSLEQRMDDVRAVMDAAGSDKAILLGISEGGPMCSLFAATYPQKTLALVMIGCYARRLQAPDYPWGPSQEQHNQFLNEIARDWGGPVGLGVRAPSKASDAEFANWWATYLRMGASPGAALALTKMNAQFDVRPILSAIQVPTLVLHRTGDRCLLVEEGRYLADQIPGAQFVELSGEDHLPFVGNQDEMLENIAEFLTGLKPHEKAHRVLATVLHAQVQQFNSQDQLNKSQRINLSHAHFVRELELFRGTAIQSADTCFSASFDGPARAIRAALAIRNSAVRLGVELQIGVHTGECEVFQQGISGPAVELAEKVALFSGKNEVLVSSTVKDLVAGSGMQFAESRTVRLSDDLLECGLYQVKTHPDYSH